MNSNEFEKCVKRYMGITEPNNLNCCNRFNHLFFGKLFNDYFNRLFSSSAPPFLSVDFNLTLPNLYDRLSLILRLS